MFLHFGLEHLNGLLGTLKGCGLKQLHQSFVAELLLLAVLGLVESVAVYEEWLVGNVGNLLALVL